jgi:hypothetical protein
MLTSIAETSRVGQRASQYSLYRSLSPSTLLKTRKHREQRQYVSAVALEADPPAILPRLLPSDDFVRWIRLVDIINHVLHGFSAVSLIVSLHQHLHPSQTACFARLHLPLQIRAL